MKTFSNSLQRVKKVQAKLEQGQWALFSQKANLTYLDFEKADFLLASNKEVYYFITKKGETERLWSGQTTVAYRYGVSKESQNLLSFLHKIKFSKLFNDLACAKSLDKTNPLCQEVSVLGKEFKNEKLADAASIVAPLRMVKDRQELEKLKQANALTLKAINHLQPFLIPGVMEWQLKAEFDYYLAQEGVLEQAFTPIIAADSSSCILHKQGYANKMQGNILFDLGAKYQNYCADISRSYFLEPSSLQEQALLWVKKAQEQVIKEAKPKMLLSDLNKICRQVLCQGLMQMGVITDKSELGNFFMHSVCHHLGLETHDLSLSDLPLQENMVITVEPGLYFWQEGFGIRIEDDIVINKDGARLLAEI